MEQGMFITAQEVAVMLGVSKSKAYAVVRELNKELSDRGFITVAGKVSSVLKNARSSLKKSSMELLTVVLAQVIEILTERSE